MRIPTENDMKRISERIYKEMEREMSSLHNPTKSQIKQISEKYARKFQREIESLMR